MPPVLLIIHVIITLSLIVIILMQRSAADGLSGLGSSGGGGLISSRAQANLLTRTTAILATLFILSSLTLTWVTQRGIVHTSLADKVEGLQVPTPDAKDTSPVGNKPSQVSPLDNPAQKLEPVAPATPAGNNAPSVPRP